MATPIQWIEAARPKTLPASLAPVFLGITAAYSLGACSLGKSALALLVAFCLQVGVNYSNDYSDGIRGTDENRKGPLRLTGAGLAKPRQVLTAALINFAIAGIAGLGLVIWSRSWWLLVAGAAAIIAAWFYTGGKRPYGYMAGVSELMVFVFFGLMATLGTLWVQVPRIPFTVICAASGIGLLSCALLMVNNLRDIPGDTEAGKHTLAVKLGDKWSRRVFFIYIILAGVLGGWSVACRWPERAVFIFAFFVAAIWPVLKVDRGAKGAELIACLKQLGILILVYSVAVIYGWLSCGV